MTKNSGSRWLVHHWVEFDKTMLALIDTDKDGRVRVPEVIAAVNDATPEGKLIAGFGRQVLGKADGGEVKFDEAAAAAATFAAKPFNGDGIVPADSASDDTPRRSMATSSSVSKFTITTLCNTSHWQNSEANSFTPSIFCAIFVSS